MLVKQRRRPQPTSNRLDRVDVVILPPGLDLRGPLFFIETLKDFE